jgi:hypothetical protein
MRFGDVSSTFNFRGDDNDSGNGALEGWAGPSRGEFARLHSRGPCAPMDATRIRGWG